MIQHKQQDGYIPGMYVRAWHRRYSGKLRGVKLERVTDEICVDEMPTVPIRVPKTTERLLPLDGNGRTSLKKAAKDRDLLDLCDEAVREYKYLAGDYPIELVLSAFRYLTLDPVSKRYGGYCTFNGDVFIPYTYDASIHFPDFCVMARGVAQDAWIR